MTTAIKSTPPADSLLTGSPYEAYLYSYPHKTAYRSLSPPRPLTRVWAKETKNTLFLYIHVPFCEMRCGFCNLFTTVKPGEDFMAGYVEAVERQAARVREALGDGARFARFALGGGTPTYLSQAQLSALLDVAEGAMGAPLGAIPMSVEMSPETAAPEKLRMLRSRGADRASIGVQSFVDAEVGAISRRQRGDQVARALDAMREAGFPTLNIDLMYGLPDQSVASWRHSLREALKWRPEELYLYPLYVRPLTRMGQSQAQWDDERLALYREGRDLLLSEGYTQISMRMFRAAHAPAPHGPVYRCQADGMVGLGCGARSYTDSLHYSSAYAVGPRDVRSILKDFIARSDEDFSQASYGFELDDEDKRRRHAILSLLSDEGLSRAFYLARFGTHLDEDLPEINALASLGLVHDEGEVLILSEAGQERSDAVGPWLFSRRVQALMGGYEAR